MILNRAEYLDQVLGCWMGKNIGGTLGAPMEWRRQVNNVSFYTQNLGGEPLPNDDLDIQLLWLAALEHHGVDLDAKTLAEWWCMFVTPHWAEYGTGKINMRRGLVPPLSGTVGNAFKDSCGSFIRAEIWACITPGCPKEAARYAYEDAILDHGDGEGTYAEIFTAALESAAFVEKDIRKLIDIGLSYIPESCAVAQAIRAAVQWHKQGKTWLEARNLTLEKFRGGTFLGLFDHTSPDDQKKGFQTGKLGWDVPSNMAIVIIGLLYGEGDFAKSICTAVNCGEDTDCTGATVGSIFGILHGYKAIPEKWITPIGRSIKTIVIDLGDIGSQIANNVDNLTERTAKMAQQVIARRGLDVEIADRPTDLSDLTTESLRAGDFVAAYGNWDGPVYHFDFFDVAVDYAGDPTIRTNEPKKVTFRIINTGRIQAGLNLHWYLPPGLRVGPSADGSVMVLRDVLGCGEVKLEFTFQAEQLARGMTRAVLEITSEGRPTVMLVPLTLLNGDLVSK